MIKEKISSQEIIDLVASKALVSKRAAEEFLKVMIATIEDALLAGEAVKIKNLGTFKLQWNEPRKSVNVQTGEEIMLAGYHKVAFTPDVILKDLVNEPFAHLQPIELESAEKEPTSLNDDEPLDSLRIFTEQASEIKSLISEIQALSPNRVKVEEKKEEVPAYEISDIENTEEEDEAEIEEQIPVKVIEDYDLEAIESVKEEPEAFVPIEINPYSWEAQKSVVKETTELDSTPFLSNSTPYLPNSTPYLSDSTSDSTPYLDGLKSRKRRKVWLIILIAFLFLIGVGSGLVFFYPPANDFAMSTVSNCKVGWSNMTEKISFSDMKDAVAKWFEAKPKPAIKPAETVIIPKDTTEVDSVAAVAPVDTLQSMFDNPRTYTTFIAAERIKPGSRLTLMSKRYYGNKEFWVYIYEANKENIPNPDEISKGTVIRIPKLDPRLIDAKNPRCLQKAKELHDKYVKKPV